MHITALEAENFKRLRVVSITPNGHVITLAGANEQGKSSVMDAVWSALGGKKAMPSKPVRRGAESAVIRLSLGDLRVTRTMTADGGTKLNVTTADGARYPTPQAVLDAITGELTFDPLRFASEEPRKQLEILRGLVKLDVDIDALDQANERDFLLRTGFNSQVKAYTDRVKTVEGSVDWTIDVTQTDVSALVDEVQNAFERNSAIAKEGERRNQMRQSIGTRRTNAAMKRDQAKRLLVEADALERSVELDELALMRADPVPAPVDVTEIRRRIDEAQKENAVKEHQAQQREQLATAKAELDAAKAAAQKLTDAIAHRTHIKEQAIGGARMPIDGLSFGNGEVLYKGIPFDQASQAERIRVSFAVAMAANPKLKVVFIKDASLLDETNLALVADMAEQHGYQVWLERVDTSGKIGIVLEDGAVTSIDGVPVEQEEAAAV